MAETARPGRVDLGFSGGQVLSLRIQEDVFASLRDALEGRGDRWHRLTTEDSEVIVDLSQVVYVRRETEREHVGF